MARELLAVNFDLCVKAPNPFDGRTYTYCGMRLLFACSRLLAHRTLLGGGCFGQTITVSFPASRSDKPLDGRVLLLLSNDPSDEPRMQIDDTPEIADGLRRNGRWMEGGRAPHYRRQCPGLPAGDPEGRACGDYTVQAVLNIYETFHRSDGKTIKLAPDRGEGQHWNLAPGNLLSKPRMVHIGRGAADRCFAR